MLQVLNKGIALSFFALSLTATAGRPAGGQGLERDDGGNNPATQVSYDVNVSLSRNPGQRGSLQVVENGPQGSRVVRNCSAIGGIENHPDGASSRRTPSGSADVYETYAHLKYRGNNGWTWIQNVNATYFDSIMGRPVAIHTGNLGSNSHACIRVDSGCSSFIKSKADATASAAGGRSSIIPGAGKRNFRMTVNVNYQ